MGPRYQRPPVDALATFRGAPADSMRSRRSAKRSGGEVFRDEELQRLITRALTENYDVRIAAAILQARAQLTITRADQFPTVTAGATATGERTRRPAKADSHSASNQGVQHVDATLAWEIDFWGKFRSATARTGDPARYPVAARAVLVSVVDLVAQSSSLLRELTSAGDARRTLAARGNRCASRACRSRVASYRCWMCRGRAACLTAASVITDTERLITQQGTRSVSPWGRIRADSARPSAGRQPELRRCLPVCRRASSSAGQTSARPNRR